MRIRLFGGMELASPSGQPIRLSTRKTSLLLAALALAGESGWRREALCAAFWPDRGEEQARSSVRQALAAIRKALGDGGDRTVGIEGDLETVRLLAADDAVDLRRFEALLRCDDGDNLAAAADLYRGEVLASIALPEPLDHWFAPHQERFRRRALALAERLSEVAGDDAATAACEGLAERLLANDPAAEEAHRALIRLYGRDGRINAALRQFDLCREALRRELSAEPEARTAALVAALRAAAPSLPTAGAAPAVARLVPRDRDQPALVVMPFDNLSGAADEYFVDGVVEEITAALSRVREFFVIARQSAFAYKGRFVDARELGRELGVDYVVEGTVRRGGERLRISVQLVDAANGAQLWSDRYEGTTTDVFDFQDRIAAQVVGAIHPALRHAEIETAKRKPPSSLKAYDLVLRAYPDLWSHNPEKNRRAMTALREAITVDPSYGRAHALLAWCHSQACVYLWSTEPEAESLKALDAVAAAAATIDDDPTALAAAGAALSQCGEQRRAAVFIEKALALDPNHAWAWARHGWVALYSDQPDQARERFERALALSPLDPLAFNLEIGIAGAIAMKGDYVEATKRMKDILARKPGLTWAYRGLAHYACFAGDQQLGKWAVKQLLATHPEASIEQMRAQHPMRHVPRYFDEIVEGLRRSGLPETSPERGR